MLQTLHIRDFVIVENTELHFQNGFTVFSGETGAGKSILIDALALALGGRGDAAVIRQGAQRTDISAIFETPPSLHDWLAQNAIDLDDTLILRRTLDTQGRSRAFINGQPVPLAHLKAAADHLIDIHGQHAHQSLLKPSSQRELLDTQGGLLDTTRQVNQAWKTWQQALTALAEAKKNAQALAKEHEQLSWQLAELDQLALAPHEWETISAEHNKLAHAQALIEGATQALNLLDNDDVPNVRHSLNLAVQAIQKQLLHDSQLQGIHDALESARISVAEAVSDLSGYLDRVDLDPGRLAQAEQRMAAIFNAARKFKVEPSELADLHYQLREKLSAAEQAGNLDALQQAADAAEKRYREHALQLGALRTQTAQRLNQAVTQAMQTLAMEGGRFQVSLTPCEPGPFGLETTEFLVAGHPGTPLRPLAKVASGGELARLSLALSVHASKAARVPTLIFDEVDTGIGGAVADVVGQLLRELGQRHQVLCVTHLPQVAACANQHFQVEKITHANGAESSISLLSKKGREQEIARMLGGLKITETTLKHAREMLQAH
jgi:DNA repair protein RecN (Recombination protein N)